MLRSGFEELQGVSGRGKGWVECAVDLLGGEGEEAK